MAEITLRVAQIVGKYRTSGTLRTQETWFVCFRCIIVNTVCEGDNKDDDDDNNNNNNNNRPLTQGFCFYPRPVEVGFLTDTVAQTHLSSKYFLLPLLHYHTNDPDSFIHSSAVQNF